MLDPRERLLAALDDADPMTAVEKVAVDLCAEGMLQVALYHLFVDQMVLLSGEDPRYDAVLDTLDIIWGGGWAKNRALYDRELTNEDVKDP